MRLALLPSVVLFICNIFNLLSQEGTLIWKNNYSKSSMCSRDLPIDAVLSNDSLLYVTGYSERNFSNYDVTTFAFDHTGDTIWHRTFSTYKNDFSYDKPRKICADNFGNVIVMGHRNINYSNSAIFILKYNKNGTLLWSDVTSWIEVDGQLTTLVGSDIIADNDGNVYLFCRYAADQGSLNTVIVKYDKVGRKSWTKNYAYNYPLFVKMNQMQNIYLIIGTGYNDEYMISKLDTSGTIIWEKLLKHDGDGAIKEIIDACVDKNNNIYLLMDIWPSIYHFPEQQDILLSKITEMGEISWESRYNGQSNNFDHGIKMNLIMDSIIIVGVSTKTINNDLDAVFLKCNTEGEKLDSLTLSGTSLNNDFIVAMTTDQNVNTYTTLISYTNAYDFTVSTLKIDSTLSMKWEVIYPSPKNAIYYPQNLFLTKNNNLVLLGNINSTTNPSLSYDTDIDYVIALLDTAGIMKKEFVYSDSGTSNFRLARMELDSLNNIYISGYSQIGPDWENFIDYFVYNYYILKYDESGELLWSKSIDNDTLDMWTYVNQFKTDSLITMVGNGYSEQTGRKYTILYCYDLNGELIKSKTIDNNGYYCSYGVDDENGNIYLYIPRYDKSNSSIIKLNSALEIEWNYHLTEISQLEEIPVIHIASDGKVYFVGKDHKLIVISDIGIFNKETNLDKLFSGFTYIYTDSLSNVYIAGVLVTQSNKASFAKIDNAGNIIWHVSDARMESVIKMIHQEKPNSFVVVGTQCSIVGCTPTIILRITTDGKISGSLSLSNLYPKEVVSDKDDFLFIANSSDYFIIVSPNLDSLYRSNRINDSICFTYSLSDIKTDADQNIYITGLFGNEVYLHSNEWNSITTLKFMRPNTRPILRDLQKYYRIMPLDTLRVNVSIDDFDNDTCTVSFTDHPDWIAFNPSASQLTFTPDSSNLGLHSIQVTITDNVGNSSILLMDVKVGNTAPVFITDPPLTMHAEENYFYEPFAEDIDNDSLYFELLEGPSWLDMSTLGALSGIPNKDDTCTCHVSLIVRDQYGGEAIQEFDIKVTLLTSTEDFTLITQQESKYLIFPNPTDEIILITPSKGKTKVVSINLVDVSGKIIISKTITLPSRGESIVLDVDAIKPAVYYLIIKEIDGTYSYPVVIE